MRDVRESDRMDVVSLPMTIQRSTFLDALLDVAHMNHTGNNHHHPGSRTNSLEPSGIHEKDRHHRGSKEHEDESSLGLLAAAEQRRQRSFKNKKVNWKASASQQYDKLGSSGESSQGVGGPGFHGFLNKQVKERGPELEPLLTETRPRSHHEYRHHHHCHHHHHHRHRKRKPYYYYDTYDYNQYDKYYPDKYRHRHHRHHHHHHHHHHRHHHHQPSSYHRHQINTYAPRSSIRYRKVSRLGSQQHP